MSKIYDVIVIGGGPAGMNVALYTSRGNLSTLVIEKGLYGGQLNNTNEIDNYLGVPTKTSGMDLANIMYAQMMEFGTEYEYGDVLEIIPKSSSSGFITIVTDIEKYYARTIVIATGTKHRTLGLDNEDTFMGRGISYCAICDGAFFKDKEIVVIGGGDSALEEGEFLTNYGKTVSLIHRRDEFRATRLLQDRFNEKENTDLILNAQVTKFIGNSVLEKIEITHLDGRIEEKGVDGAFVYVGLDPITEPFQSLNILNEKGYVLTNEHMATTQDGIFAVGDVREKTLRQVATAVGDGAIAGTEVYNYIANLPK